MARVVRNELILCYEVKRRDRRGYHMIFNGKLDGLGEYANTNEILKIEFPILFR